MQSTQESMARSQEKSKGDSSSAASTAKERAHPPVLMEPITGVGLGWTDPNATFGCPVRVHLPLVWLVVCYAGFPFRTPTRFKYIRVLQRAHLLGRDR